MLRFRDRQGAGRSLAAELQAFAPEHPLVLALPRGGVPIGYEIARALGCELDVWVVRKLGVPWRPELGLGAVAAGGYTYLNQDILRYVRLPENELAELIELGQREVEAQLRRYRGQRGAPVLRNRVVILVDDGIATGGTVRAAIATIRGQEPRRLVLAVPVAASQTIRSLAAEVDRVVCLRAPTELYSIGLWYDDFTQLSDDEVRHYLEHSRSIRERPSHHPPSL